MKLLLSISIIATAFVLTGCDTVQYALTTGDENLFSLTKVTDNEEPCITPYGGDYGQNLYYAARENKKYFNIYKKDNVFAAATIQKTSGNNRNYSPCYNDELKRIAFRCQMEGSSTSDIYSMDANKGKTFSPMTESSEAFENNPCYSPDGKWLTYDRQSYSFYKKISWKSLFGLGEDILIVENSEIWLKNLQTNENILLSKGYQPSFSPDGKSIVYTKYSSDAKSCSIWIMNIDGSNQIQVTDAKKGYAFAPCWSPDGKRIIFQATKKDKKDADLYIINSDGEGLTQLTSNKSFDGQPYWTKDNYIYFVSDRGNKKGNLQIWGFKLPD